MLTGLEILIARMKDHPDEFTKHYKWDGLIEDFRENFTLDEWEAYKAARNEMMRDMFNEAVLKRLAGEEESDIEKAKAVVGKMAYRAQGKYATNTAVDSQSLFGQSIMNNPMLAAKQANAARQQEAYNTAYSEQRGLQNSGTSGFFTPFV